jgi:hypothetical protein
MNSRISASEPARPSASSPTADMIWPGVQKPHCSASWRTKAALQRMKRRTATQALDRRDFASIALCGEGQARQHALSVEQDGARTTSALITALLRAGERQPLAKDVEKRLVNGDTQLAGRPIHGGGQGE